MLGMNSVTCYKGVTLSCHMILYHPFVSSN